jgi:hypothetical protein
MLGDAYLGNLSTLGYLLENEMTSCFFHESIGPPFPLIDKKERVEPLFGNDNNEKRKRFPALLTLFLVYEKEKNQRTKNVNDERCEWMDTRCQDMK